MNQWSVPATPGPEDLRTLSTNQGMMVNPSQIQPSAPTTDHDQGTISLSGDLASEVTKKLSTRPDTLNTQNDQLTLGGFGNKFNRIITSGNHLLRTASKVVVRIRSDHVWLA